MAFAFQQGGKISMKAVLFGNDWHPVHGLTARGKCPENLKNGVTLGISAKSD